MFFYKECILQTATEWLLNDNKTAFSYLECSRDKLCIFNQFVSEEFCYLGQLNNMFIPQLINIPVHCDIKCKILKAS